jgi:hypothetical protein
MNQELYQQTIDFREKTSEKVARQLSRNVYKKLDIFLWGNLYDPLFWGFDKEIREGLRKKKA